MYLLITASASSDSYILFQRLLINQIFNQISPQDLNCNYGIYNNV